MQSDDSVSEMKPKTPSAPSEEAEASSHQRSKPRYAAHLQVEIFTRGLEHQIVEKTANISNGGLFLCTEMESQVGEKMHLRIIFKDRKAYFDVKGEVVWVCDGGRGHPKGLGIQFTELNPAQQEVIDRYLVDYVNIRTRP